MSAFGGLAATQGDTAVAAKLETGIEWVVAGRTTEAALRRKSRLDYRIELRVPDLLAAEFNLIQLLEEPPRKGMD